jgi:dipeptidyl aminopeptidase/acylaminoacyl peptidase
MLAVITAAAASGPVHTLAAPAGLSVSRGGPDPGLYLIDLKTGHEARLTDGADSDAAWSPDGEMVAFTRKTSDGAAPHRTINILTLGNGLRRVTTSLDAWSPSWSIRGSRLAFLTPRGVYTVNVSRAAVSQPHLAAVLPTLIGRLAWNRNGAGIYVGIPGRGIAEISLPTGSVREIVRDPFLSTFSTAPMRDSLVYARRTPAGRSELYIVQLDNGKRTKLSALRISLTEPAWSYDGDLLAAATGPSPNRFQARQREVYVFAPKARWKPMRVTRNRVEDYDPAWRP